MQAFCDSMNRSSWRGVIAEAGLGLDFSAGFVRIPGASNTIMKIVSDYEGLDVPHGMRAVSLDNAKRMAHESLAIARSTLEEYEPGEHRFGLAITGAHYSDRPSHGWIYITTQNWDAYMHFSVATSTDREWVGRIVSDRVQWFMTACMLEPGRWVEHIENIGDSLETHNIDVLYGPGLSDIERLLLLRPRNPLAYVGGEFGRVIDIVRQYDTVYPGAFNPPTKKHLAVRKALFEISQRHYYKGGVALEDLLHRMRMLSEAGQAVIITQAPRFIDKVKLLREVCEMQETEFIVGADAWNATIAHHQYPSTSFLKDNLGVGTSFRIMPRTGVTIEENHVGNTLKYFVEAEQPEFDGINSTDVRESLDPGCHSYLTDAVGCYVARHRLYGGQAAETVVS